MGSQNLLQDPEAFTVNDGINPGTVAVQTIVQGVGLVNPTAPNPGLPTKAAIHDGVGTEAVQLKLNGQIGRIGAITNATNANPIVITSPGHGLASGDQVQITGISGNTNANGNFRVTVINSNTFRCRTSVTAPTSWAMASIREAARSMVVVRSRFATAWIPTAFSATSKKLPGIPIPTSSAATFNSRWTRCIAQSAGHS